MLCFRVIPLKYRSPGAETWMVYDTGCLLPTITELSCRMRATKCRSHGEVK